MAELRLNITRVIASSLSCAMIATTCRKREDRRALFKLTAGAGAIVFFGHGIPRWLRGFSFFSFNGCYRSVLVASFPPVLYSSHAVLAKSDAPRLLDQWIPGLHDFYFRPYVQTFLFTSIGSLCLSAIHMPGPLFLLPYLSSASAVFHYGYDYVNVRLAGRYRKQVLRLHFPHIADELEEELVIRPVHIPLFTNVNSRATRSQEALRRLEELDNQLRHETEIYRAMQEEVFRLREKLYADEGHTSAAKDT